MFVLLTWVLEATSNFSWSSAARCPYLHPSSSSPTDFRDEPKPAPEANLAEGLTSQFVDGVINGAVMSNLYEKPHIFKLLKYVAEWPLEGWKSGAWEFDTSAPTYGGSMRVLHRSSPVISPWNFTFVLGAMLAAWLGDSLVPELTRITTAATAVVILSTAVLLMKTWSGPAHLLLITMSTGTISAVGFADIGSSGMFATAPWLALSATYVSFRRMSYAELKASSPPALLRSARNALAAKLGDLLHWIVGDDTWRYTGFAERHTGENSENVTTVAVSSRDEDFQPRGD